MRTFRFTLTMVFLLLVTGLVQAESAATQPTTQAAVPEVELQITPFGEGMYYKIAVLRKADHALIQTIEVRNGLDPSTEGMTFLRTNKAGDRTFLYVLGGGSDDLKERRWYKVWAFDPPKGQFVWLRTTEPGDKLEEPAATQPVSIPYDTHTGYFVSNKFEPNAVASFVVLRNQQAFDKVFGAGFVMNDKSHRLPADAFDTKIVVSAIKRGNAVVEFKVSDLTLNAGVLTVRYTTTSTKQDAAEFACPLIVSVPKGDYIAVEFVEDGKSVRKIELKQAPTQPAAFDIRCEKKADAVAVTADADRTLFTITSASGIGGATIERKGDSWPKQLVLRVHLRGLESLGITTGDLKLSASVASHSGNPRTLILAKKDGKDSPPLAKDSPYWMDILALDAKGKPVNGLPDKDGYFEMVFPKALLDDNASKLTIGWIDFYR